MLKMAQISISDPNSDALIKKWCENDDFIHAAKFKSKHRQKQSLAGRCLVRMLYAYFCGHKGQKLLISTTETGQPVLKISNGADQIWTSISHSNERVCAIISDLSPVGIDIEFMGAKRDIVRLIKQIFPKFVGSKQAAYQFWTLNEAYGKAIGEGIDFTKADIFSEICQGIPSEYCKQSKTIIKDDYIISIFCLCTEAFKSKKWIDLLHIISCRLGEN